MKLFISPSRTKRNISLFLFLFIFASSIYARNTGQWTRRQARKWVQKREWAQGLNAMPHPTTDCREFALQYHKNKNVWDKTFQWLATHDLKNMPAGRYEVDGEHCYINIEDVMTQNVEKRKIEGHRHHIDLQFVVKGTERFGITSARYAEAITEYKPDVTFYRAKKIKYADSTPDHFFLFFPKDFHQPLVKAGEKPENVRVVVAKIEYIH